MASTTVTIAETWSSKIAEKNSLKATTTTLQKNFRILCVLEFRWTGTITMLAIPLSHYSRTIYFTQDTWKHWFSSIETKDQPWTWFPLFFWRFHMRHLLGLWHSLRITFPCRIVRSIFKQDGWKSNPEFSQVYMNPFKWFPHPSQIFAKFPGGF